MTRTVALLLLAVPLQAGCGSGDDGERARPAEPPVAYSSAPQTLPPVKPRDTVTFEVTGKGPADIEYHPRDPGDPVALKKVRLPWSKSIAVGGGLLVDMFAAGTGKARLTCRIKVNGAEVVTRTKESAVSCNHLLR